MTMNICLLFGFSALRLQLLFRSVVVVMVVFSVFLSSYLGGKK